jgi:hypothetical protein
VDVLWPAVKLALVDGTATALVDTEWVVLVATAASVEFDIRAVTVAFSVWWLVGDAVVAELLLPVGTVLWVTELLVCTMVVVLVIKETDVDVGVWDEPLNMNVAAVFTVAIVVELRTVALGDASSDVVLDMTLVSLLEDCVGPVKLVVPGMAVEEIVCFVLSRLWLVVDDKLEVVGPAADVEELWTTTSTEVT